MILYNNIMCPVRDLRFLQRDRDTVITRRMPIHLYTPTYLCIIIYNYIMSPENVVWFPVRFFSD